MVPIVGTDPWSHNINQPEASLIPSQQISKTRFDILYLQITYSGIAKMELILRY